MNQPLIRVDNILGDNIGYIELWDMLGNDQRIAAAARVSLNRELSSLADDSERQQERDAGLIRRLVRDRHTSPLEQVVFTWRIRWPVFVARQAMRHRFGSWNEESGRFIELPDETFVPSRLRVQIGKAMDYQYEDMNSESNAYYLTRIRNLYRDAQELYQSMLANRVAREHARMVLPFAHYTTTVWTVNALALLHFLHLRNSPHAQAEIRAYAEAIEGIVAERLPVTYAAYKEYWGDGIGMIV